MRLYELGLLKDPEWYIRDMDEPDIDEILEKESMLNQANQMIAQLQQEIKKLQGDLQTSTRETIQANQKVEVEKFKSKLSGATSKIEANVQLAQQRLGDYVKSQKPSENGSEGKKSKQE